MVKFLAGVVVGAFIATAINVAVFKYPNKPPEMRDDPYATPWGETWRVL